MVRNINRSGSATQSGHFHNLRTRTNARMVSIAIVPVTAIPYAPARLLEEPKPSTNPITAASRTQLIQGK